MATSIYLVFKVIDPNLPLNRVSLEQVYSEIRLVNKILDQNNNDFSRSREFYYECCKMNDLTFLKIAFYSLGEMINIGSDFARIKDLIMKFKTVRIEIFNLLDDENKNFLFQLSKSHSQDFKDLRRFLFSFDIR